VDDERKGRSGMSDTAGLYIPIHFGTSCYEVEVKKAMRLRYKNRMDERWGEWNGKPCVAILGCGPSAAFAYRACRDVLGGPSEATVHVYGIHKDYPKGAFWLHWLPESVLSSPLVLPGRITVQSIGTREEYVYKQWGRTDIPSSFPYGSHVEHGYAPAIGLAALWNPTVSPQPGDLPTVFNEKLDEARIIEIAEEYDIVIQTFPKMAEKYPAVKFPIAWKVMPNIHFTRDLNRVLYDGTSSHVVRSSWLWGVESHELVSGTPTDFWEQNGFEIQWRWDIPPDVEAVLAEPPKPNILYLGRYAEWRRKALSHEAYGATQLILKTWEEASHE
jgi:hypothetical protein